MHSPCDHFARIGYDYLIDRLPAHVIDTQPDDDAEDERPGTLEDWRQRAVLAMIRGPIMTPKMKPKPTADDAAEVKEKPLTLAGVRIYWPGCLPRLAVWRGARATLETIVAKRVAACWSADLPFGTALLDWRLPLDTQSGLDPRSCVDALDAGFSPAVLGMPIIAYPAAELLAIVGMEVTPITRHGYDPLRYSYYDHHGSRWEFGVEDRAGTHYRRLTYATPTVAAEPGTDGTLRAAVIARAKSLGLTAYAIARDTGGMVSPDHMRAYLTGAKDMTGERLDAVMRVLGMHVTGAK